MQSRASEICHASSAWLGFTSVTDRQHLKAFLRRIVRSRLCPPELSDLTELVEAADDKLFRLILKDNHILSSLLPPKSDNRYNLRKKHHNREQLPTNTHLFDCNFIVRLLCKDWN